MSKKQDDIKIAIRRSNFTDTSAARRKPPLSPEAKKKVDDAEFKIPISPGVSQKR